MPEGFQRGTLRFDFVFIYPSLSRHLINSFVIFPGKSYHIPSSGVNSHLGMLTWSLFASQL